MNKSKTRQRRAAKGKHIIKRKSTRPRLVVFRSNGHTYAQIMTAGENGDQVLASCSTLDREFKATGTKVEQAYEVGKLLGNRAKDKGVSIVAYDRAGYKYHGRVAALAKGARDAGLNF